MSDSITEYVNSHDDFINPEIHQKLVGLARAALNKGMRGNTLDTHDVVNESIVKFYNLNSKEFSSRSHFYATMSTIMRNLIIDHIRKKQASVNGGDKFQMTLSAIDKQDEDEIPQIQVLEMEDAIIRVGKAYKDLEEIIVIRFYGGASIDELAGMYNTSKSSIKRKLRFARALLKKELR